MNSFDIEKSVGFLLAKAYQRLFAHFRTLLEPYGITPQQFALLAFLWKQDGLSQTELAERTEVDRTTLGGLVDRLEKLKLVRRERHPQDRRAFLIFLTAEGRQLETELPSLALEVRERFTAKLAPAEYDQLCKLLEKLRS